VSGLKTALSNCGTIVPGEKLPKDPPCLEDEHVEKLRAHSSNDDSPLVIIFNTFFASGLDFTSMCRAVAETFSGGGPYSVFEKAFVIPSNKPIERDDFVKHALFCDDRSSRDETTDLVVKGENPFAVPQKMTRGITILRKNNILLIV